MQVSYVIPECNLNQLHDLIEKANKAAKKLGVRDILISEMEIDHRQFYVCKAGCRNTIGVRRYWVDEDKFDESKHDNLGSVRNWVKVIIDGEQPKFSGWTFCATLMPVPTDDGMENEIRKVPGVESNMPKDYRSRAGECDHCKKNRRRNETYVVRDDNDNFKMVGSSCIKDFLGHSDPHAIAQYLSSIYSIDVCCGDLDEERWYSDKEPDAYNALSVLGLTSGVIREFGWMSKKQVWENQYGIATASRVLAFLKPPHLLSAEERKQQEKATPTIDDINRAKDVFEWMQSLDRDSDNEYIYNLSLLSRSEYINAKSLGLLCSAVSSYNREQANKEKAKDFVNSEYVGNIKERIEIDVTVKRIFEKEGNFGLTRIHHMLTPEGNYLVWFASGMCGFQVGETCRVKATIKKHSEYNGVKQTIVNRVTPIKEKV